MVISLYYKQPEPDDGAYNEIIKNNYPDIEPYSSKFWEKYRKYVKSLVKKFGKLVSADEDLYIVFNTNKPEIIDVNGSKYRLVT